MWTGKKCVQYMEGGAATVAGTTATGACKTVKWNVTAGTYTDTVLGEMLTDVYVPTGYAGQYSGQSIVKLFEGDLVAYKGFPECNPALAACETAGCDAPEAKLALKMCEMEDVGDWEGVCVQDSLGTYVCATDGHAASTLFQGGSRYGATTNTAGSAHLYHVNYGSTTKCRRSIMGVEAVANPVGDLNYVMTGTMQNIVVPFVQDTLTYSLAYSCPTSPNCATGVSEAKCNPARTGTGLPGSFNLCDEHSFTKFRGYISSAGQSVIDAVFGQEFAHNCAPAAAATTTNLYRKWVKVVGTKVSAKECEEGVNPELCDYGIGGKSESWRIYAAGMGVCVFLSFMVVVIGTATTKANAKKAHEKHGPMHKAQDGGAAGGAGGANGNAPAPGNKE